MKGKERTGIFRFQPEVNEEGSKTFQGLGFLFQCENLSVLVFIYPIKFSKSSLINKPIYLTVI